MTHLEYQSIRQALGTQEHVAKLVGVCRVTIARREMSPEKAGALAVTSEAALAILQLLSKTTKRKAKP